jgi:hypothetical protein
MIKIEKEFDGQWVVWDTNTQRTATIVRIDDYFMGQKKKCHYRVDYKGRTVETMIELFHKAKSTASKQVR